MFCKCNAQLVLSRLSRMFFNDLQSIEWKDRVIRNELFELLFSLLFKLLFSVYLSYHCSGLIDAPISPKIKTKKRKRIFQSSKVILPNLRLYLDTFPYFFSQVYSRHMLTMGCCFIYIYRQATAYTPPTPHIPIVTLTNLILYSPLLLISTDIRAVCWKHPKSNWHETKSP